jgi:NAD(P)-dependent dehydrogenase (short-subunit alcohol dehydrogenase family)
VAAPDVSRRSITELLSLQGRIAVVTGGAAGTGLGISRRLVEAGASLVVADSNERTAEQVAQSLRDAGRTALGFELDLRDELSIKRLAERVMEEFGSIDVWVNNAGVYPATPALEMTASQWNDVVDYNLRGVFLCAREAAKCMTRSGRGGVIINVSSTAAFRASGAGMAHYVSSKFGVRGLTKALAVEFAPHDIRVLEVAPTFIDTPGTRARRQDLDDFAYQQLLKETGARKLLGRVGVPDDVARVVLFCASDLSVLMTGSTLAVDAGELAR